jgi:magnesium chelatase family protein
LLDRIDLQIEVQPVSFEDMSKRAQGESSQVIRDRVIGARKFQARRYKGENHLHCNAQMTVKQIRSYCAFGEEARNLLKHAMKNLNLSARAYDRIIKVARTIADLQQSERILPEHVAEGVQYRSLDRMG